MNPRTHGNPGSFQQDRRRGNDSSGDRDGRLDSFRGASDDQAGDQGDGARSHDTGERPGAAHPGHDPYRKSSSVPDSAGDRERRVPEDPRGGHGDSPASTYGGLGGPGPYGTHGWSRRGDGYDVDDRQFDADYRQWREQQMNELDRDYAQWRQERYRQFSEEFDRWRASRRAHGQASMNDESGGTSSPGGSTAVQAPKTG